MPDKKYSVCMLCYNESKTLKASIESLIELKRLEEVEIIVVDNCSTDGSWELLKEYQNKNLIKCLRQRCSRGLGRQIAFDYSSGSYILAHMDCDDVFDAKGLYSLLEAYHSKFEGLMMMTKKSGSETSNITIAPRDLLHGLGGWRDLNWSEDWDLWARAAAIDKYYFFSYPYSNPPHKIIRVRKDRTEKLLLKLITRYNKYRDAIRIGRPMFSANMKPSLTQELIYYLAKLNVNLTKSQLTPISNPQFKDVPEPT